MSKHNDGGPAFPGFKHYTDGGQVITGAPHGGMSLRDYFAAKAMPALLNDPWYTSGVNAIKTAAEIAPHLASDAYEIADAMLAELEE